MTTPTTRYAGVADVYARTFAHLCSGPILQMLTKHPPGRLLDVGAGTGSLSFAAARRGHQVTAVEPDTDMARALRIRHPQLPVLSAGLPGLPMHDGTFDGAIANFVINHVAEPLSSVSTMARVVRPGGRVSASIWRAGESGMGTLFNLVAEAAGAVRPELPRLAAELDFERTPASLSGLFDAAGLANIEASELSWAWRVDPADFWLAPQAGLAGIGVAYLAQTASVRARMDEAYADLHRSFMDDGRLALPATAVIATGIRAS